RATPSARARPPAPGAPAPRTRVPAARRARDTRAGAQGALPNRRNGGWSRIQLADHGRMVRGALEPPRLRVDGARRARFRERAGEQHVVDAQAHLPLERVQAVVPPRERFLRLLEEAERIHEARIEQALQCGAFGLAEEDAALPGERVVDVARVRRDV